MDAKSLFVQSNGKILVAGHVDGTYGFAISRFNSNGSLDGSFGTGGLDTTVFMAYGMPASSYAKRVIVQPDGKILVGGAAHTTASVNFSLALARYLGEGCNPCPAPTSPSISTVTSNAATVSWTGNACAVKYRVHLQNLYNGAGYIYQVNAPITTYTFSNLQPNTQYSVMVRTLCNATGTNASGFTNTLYFTTTGSGNACVPPSNISSTNISNTSRKITWTPVAGSVGYQLRYRKTGTLGWTNIAINFGATNNRTITALTPNTSYEVQMRTKCTASPVTYSTYSSSYFFTTPLREDEEQSDFSQESISVVLYPNPSSGTVHFNSGGASGTLSLFDLQGKLVRSDVIGEADETVLYDLPNGMLLFRFVSENGLVGTGKLIVVRD